MIIAISATLLFIVLRFTVTLFNYISNPKLTRVNKPYDSLVSILIPARNEEENILTLLHAIRQQDYRNYEVIVYDDDSTDGTYAICQAFAARAANFRVVKGDTLPNGWTGKNYACHQLGLVSKGRYLLFLDADVVINKGLINSAVNRLKTHRLGLLSLVPNQQMRSFGEKTIVPLLHFVLLSLLPLRLIYLLGGSFFATASGQFMFFDAEVYRDNQYHSQVKDSVIEDTAIMKLVKNGGHRAELLLANGMLSCRMYKNYQTALNGFSKNILSAFNFNIMALLFFIILLIGGPMLILITLNINLIFFMAGLILLNRAMISLAAGQNAWQNLVMHPLQMINLTIIAFLSIQRQLTNTTRWKGRSV